MKILFAIIEADADMDGCNDLRCIGSYASKQEAEYEKNTILSKMQEKTSLYRKYVETFVDNIEIPENLEYKGWLNFLADFDPFGRSYTLPKDFKKELKYFLLQGRLLKVPDKYNYSPPPYCFVKDDFFIIEIPVIE